MPKPDTPTSLLKFPSGKPKAILLMLYASMYAELAARARDDNPMVSREWAEKGDFLSRMFYNAASRMA